MRAGVKARRVPAAGARRGADAPVTALRMVDEGGQATSERRLFGVSGVIVVEGVANVLMMGATPSTSEPVVLIELMYIDPQQFAQSDASAASSSS